MASIYYSHQERAIDKLHTISMIEGGTLSKIKTEIPDDKASKGARETLSWMLDTLTRASGIRLSFYKKQQKVAEEFALKIKTDEMTGAVVENAEQYCAAHANLIFLTNQTIESYHGTLTAANYLSRKKVDLTRVSSILLDPRNEKGGIISTLRKGTLSSKTRSSVMSIPRTEFFQEPERSELKRILRPCFDRFDLCTKYSFDYWDTLKPTRNAYAHNYRFIFYKVSAPFEKPQFDESILGLLPQKLESSSKKKPPQNDDFSVSDLMKDMTYVGFFQRFATGKLVSQLTMFERWIYLNLRNRIWNNDTPVLPENIPYLLQENAGRYAEIRESQRYGFHIPKRTDYGKYDKAEQERLHKQFLFDLQKQGEPISMVDQFGNTRDLKFLDEDELNPSEK